MAFFFSGNLNVLKRIDGEKQNRVHAQLDITEATFSLKAIHIYSETYDVRGVRLFYFNCVNPLLYLKIKKCFGPSSRI